MRILIIGSEGQLGSSLTKLSASIGFAHFESTTFEKLDISQEVNIAHFFSTKKYDFIINCTAYTDVDKAEEEQETARVINGFAPGWIGKYAKKMNAHVIHISTDYVFAGTSNLPLTPEDIEVNPLSVYGKTKFEGEQNLLKEHPESIIIRTSWLYSTYGNNFVKTMLRLGKEKDSINVLFDQMGTPTYASDLASAILVILEKAAENPNSFIPGIYHYSNEGACSWYDFAQMIFRLSGITCKVNAVRSDSFPTLAQRPTYSVMDKQKISKQFGITIPFWVDSLEECLKLLLDPQY